jgi:hypothetical protein
MNDKKRPDAFEHNVASLLKASFTEEPELQDRLLRAVLNEVRPDATAGIRRRRARALRWIMPAAAAVALIIAALHLLFPGTPAAASQVRTLYGLAELKAQDIASSNGQIQPIMNEWTLLPPYAQIQTRWGSQAEVLLADQSRLLSRSQTTLAFERGRKGERVIMDRGWISVEAARQKTGQSLQIQTPGACISVIGTKFDVHVTQKENGRRQTRVTVSSGEVRMESGGQVITLEPNTEGVAEEGEAPIRRCQMNEINELLRLRNLGARLAGEQRIDASEPSIIQFHSNGTATVWLVAHLTEARLEMRIKTSVTEVAAYDMDGVPIAAELDEERSCIRFSESQQDRLILRLDGVPGLFSNEGRGTFGFNQGRHDESVLSICQIWLPQFANIEEIQPKPIETSRALARQSVTIAVHALPPDLVD